MGVFALLKGSGKEIRIREQRKSGCVGFGGALVRPGLLEVGLGSGQWRQSWECACGKILGSDLGDL